MRIESLFSEDLQKCKEIINIKNDFVNEYKEKIKELREIITINGYSGDFLDYLNSINLDNTNLGAIDYKIKKIENFIESDYTKASLELSKKDQIGLKDLIKKNYSSTQEINESIEEILCKISESKPLTSSEDKRCIECDSDRLIITPENYWVCENCGLEYSISYQANSMTGERRAFNMDQLNARKITEPVYIAHGPRTTVGKYYDDVKLTPKMKQKVKIIRRIQSRFTDNLDRNYARASLYLKNMSSNLDIAEFVKKTAMKIYEKVFKKNLIQGRTIESVASASLYAAIRIHEIPRLLDDIVKESNIDKNIIHRNMGIIVRQILPELGLKYKPVSPLLFIPTFGQNLKIPIEIYTKASEFYKKAKRQGLKYVGKDPKSFAASCIYLVALDTDHKVTEKALADISGITEVTIRNRLKELKKYLVS